MLAHGLPLEALEIGRFVFESQHFMDVMGFEENNVGVQNFRL